MIDSAATLNALTEQKNRLRGQIEAATEVEHLQDAFKVLEFCKMLWLSLGYGYKARELFVLLAERARFLSGKEVEFSKMERKYSAAARRARKDAARLDELETASWQQARTITIGGIIHITNLKILGNLS